MNFFKDEMVYWLTARDHYTFLGKLPTSHLGPNVGLGEGRVGSFPETYLICTYYSHRPRADNQDKRKFIMQQSLLTNQKQRIQILSLKNYNTWATCIKSCLSSLSPITSPDVLFFSIKSARLSPEMEKKPKSLLYIIKRIRTNSLYF